MKKRIVLVAIALTLIVGQVSAIDFSWGASFGLGKPVFRGDYAEALMDETENYDKLESDDFFVNMLENAPLIETTILIGISPYFAIETGFGLRSFALAKTKKTGDNTHGIAILNYDFIIPLMARGRYDIGIFSVYGALGPKFIIPAAGLLNITYLTYEPPKGREPTVELNTFLVDLGFALGFEVKLGSLHIGLRGSYDLNLISPIKSVNGSDIEWYHDNLNLSITFRDAVK